MHKFASKWEEHEAGKELAVCITSKESYYIYNKDKAGNEYINIIEKIKNAGFARCILLMET